MKAQDIIIAHPNTNEQIEAIKAFMKALKIKFEVSELNNYLDELENSFTQVKQMQEGKIEKQQLNDFLNEL